MYWIGEAAIPCIMLQQCRYSLFSFPAGLFLSVHVRAKKVGGAAKFTQS